MSKLPLLLAALLAAPAPALAAPATIVSRDVPVSASRTLAAASPRFTLVGLHWKGSGRVVFRTRSVAGRWSAWRDAAPEREDLPDRASGESRLERSGWTLGNPYWTGPSDALQVRRVGNVARVRAHYVWSAPETAPERALQLAGAPAIVPRLTWGANELLKRAPPSYADSLSFAVVHHTAGSNAYTREQSGAIVKGIQLYHVRGNGWNDIGYNFLVDKYGQVFEGRYGGMTRNVIGAHAEGFNTGSVGVALLGSYGSTAPSAAAKAALVSLLAWRLDLAHLDPLSTFNWISGGNARFPSGIPVFLRTIVGHRDTGFTDCPGSKLYGQLDTLARTVSLTGLPKLYAPAVKGSPGGPVRFTGRVSGTAPWTVTVRDSEGATMAERSGLGPTLDWTWDASRVGGGPFTWTIGGEGIRPATGTFGRRAPVPLTLTHVVATPSAVTPNGDGIDDSATISYRLSLPATVSAILVDPDGNVLSTFFSEAKPAGDQSFVFAPQGLAAGPYRIDLTAIGLAGKVVTASVGVLVNPILSGFAAARPTFSPNGDGRADTMGFRFMLALPARVQLRILRAGAWVATPVATVELPPGQRRFSWDGSKRIGRALDGAFEAELTVTDDSGSVVQTIPFAVDNTPPQLTLSSVKPLRVQVSEPSRIVVVANGRREVVAAAGAGAYAVPGASAPRKVRAVAWDLAGNVSRPATYAARR